MRENGKFVILVDTMNTDLTCKDDSITNNNIKEKNMLLKYCLSTGLDTYVDLILDKSTLSKHIQLLLTLSTTAYTYNVL